MFPFPLYKTLCYQIFCPLLKYINYILISYIARCIYIRKKSPKVNLTFHLEVLFSKSSFPTAFNEKWNSTKYMPFWYITFSSEKSHFFIYHRWDFFLSWRQGYTSFKYTKQWFNNSTCYTLLPWYMQLSSVIRHYYNITDSITSDVFFSHLT